VTILQNALAQFVGPNAIFYALLAVGLNLHFGYTGLLNFGQIGFALMGAYGVGIMVVVYGQPLWVGVLVGLVGAGLLAVVLGVPTLRLRADYLAIVTIAASEILRLVFRSTASDSITQSTRGINGFSSSFDNLNPFDGGRRYSALGLGFSGNDLWAMTVGWTLVVLLSLLVLLLVRSPWGRVLKAVREDEDAARSGKNVFVYKMQALVLGGVIGGIGGIFNSLSIKSINPDSFSTTNTFYAYAALILGGAATVVGPVLGAMIFWFLISLADNVLRQLTDPANPTITFITGDQVGGVTLLFVGVLLSLLIVFRPQGMLGDKREVQLDA